MTLNLSGSTHFRVIQSTDTEEVQHLPSLPDPGQDETLLVAEETEILAPETSQMDVETLGAAALPLPASEELKPATTGLMQPASRTDSPSKKKGMAPFATRYYCQQLVISEINGPFQETG